MNVSFDIKALQGITQDSRRVKASYLFAALPGSRLDGRDYIADAVRNGAAAILAPEGTVLPDLESAASVTLLTDSNPRRALALLCAAFYDAQPDNIVAVTGTNGKTSVVNFSEQLWRMCGLRAASLGTLGVSASGVSRSGTMTTPGPVALHAELADLTAAGVTHLALEASSHGLCQHRLDGVRLGAAGFTNLSHDHLDYHGDLVSYRDSKLRLFSDVLAEGGVAVLNADSDVFEYFESVARRRGLTVWSYGFAGEALKLLGITPTPQGQAVKMVILGRDYEVTLPLVGDFQVMNALCALGLVLAGEESRVDDYVQALARLKGVPGRLELIGGHPQGAAVYVDYAHTPDALENVLRALRPHIAGRLVCVFGCGGDRDAAKRGPMGRIAVSMADRVIVTDDNPRSEDPAQIRAAILAHAPGAREIGDRRAAIHTAIRELQAGDVLVIAGKGHERGQIFDGYTEEFDDCEEARRVMAALGQAGDQGA